MEKGCMYIVYCILCRLRLRELRKVFPLLCQNSSTFELKIPPKLGFL